MNPALLILDAQNDFFGSDNPNLIEFEKSIPTINSAIELFRKYCWPVMFVQHTSKSKPPSSPAWEICKEIEFQPTDARITKTYKNAFWNTELDSLLKSHQVDYLVIAGFIAEQCVLSTLRGAQERGYDGVILEGAIASLDNRYTQFTLEISPHISLEAFKQKWLVNQRPPRS